jgi:hypothetical protein
MGFRRTATQTFCYRVNEHFLQIDEKKEITNLNKGRL